MGESQIRSTLAELHGLFLTVNERNWAEIVAEFMAYTVLGCGQLSRIKSSISGMGRMNDVYICRHNGHFVEDEQAANEMLRHLTHQLYEQVVQLQKELGC